MNQLDTTIDTHLEAYAEADPVRRRVWAADGRLVDPPLEGAGHSGIDDMAAALQTQFPGHTFRRTTPIDAHHGFARYEWAMLAPDGTTVLSGLDVAEVADDGTLHRVVGFFGPLAAA
jgi:hypothetical protein